MPHAIAVPDLDGVAAAVLLLAVCYSQLAAGVRALNANVSRPIFNLSSGNETDNQFKVYRKNSCFFFFFFALVVQHRFNRKFKFIIQMIALC